MRTLAGPSASGGMEDSKRANDIAVAICPSGKVFSNQVINGPVSAKEEGRRIPTLINSLHGGGRKVGQNHNQRPSAVARQMEEHLERRFGDDELPKPTR